jgi:hypothetical protein
VSDDVRSGPRVDPVTLEIRSRIGEAANHVSVRPVDRTSTILSTGQESRPRSA